MKKSFRTVLAAVLLICILLAAAFVAYKVYRQISWNNFLTQEKLDAIADSCDNLMYYNYSYPLDVDHYSFDYSWMDRDKPVLIAHALGGIDGNTYTNSLEALELAYENGLRVFEADFQIVDGQLLLLHDLPRAAEMCGFESENFSSAEFLTSSLYGSYTPMAWRDLLVFMDEHPDVYVVTDTKYGQQPHMSYAIAALTAEAMEHDASLLDRVVVQIYNEQMLDIVMDIHPFRSVIYTLYMSPDDNERVKAFCAASGVGAVTMHTSRYTDEFADSLNALGVLPLVHTVNDPQQSAGLVASGVAGIYTDFMTPKDMAG